MCAVPLHTIRFWRRGYNQAALLGKALAVELNTPYLSALLRARPTRQQARLTRAERFENVRAAFRIRVEPEILRGKCILLVDDVVTSGATVAACKEGLLAAGARSVKIAAVARANLS